jgi:uncharacterized cupredoxin-like copper-binding protein
MTNRFFTAAFVLALGVSGANAHGGEDHGTGETAFGHPGKAKDVSRTVKIAARDYEFNPAQLSFAKGETIKFVVVNGGRHMHELTIGDAATQEQHRDMMTKMSDMAHDHDDSEMPSNSVHVKPGETGELIWTFTKAGALEFACNFPGHADLGMEGKIEVK